MDTITGTLQKINTFKRDTKWGVITLKLSGKETIKAVGILGDHIIPGLEYKITGQRLTHPKFGEQIRIKNIKCTNKSVDSEDNVVSYLSHFKGIGPKTAELIYEEYGNDAVRIIKESPELLIDIKGISSRKVDEISGQLYDMKDDQELIDFMLLHGVSTFFLQSIKERFQEDSLRIMKENPYELTRIRGIGFITADRMAQKFGIDPKSPKRIQAAVNHYLMNDNRGNIFLATDELTLGVARKYLGNIGGGLIDIELDDMIRNGEVISEKSDTLVKQDELSDLTYARYHYNTEINVAKHLSKMLNNKIPAEDIHTWKSSMATISDTQKEAIQTAFNERVSVIHGPAGSGKSTVVGEIIQAADDAGLSPLVVSFTGRAAQRVKEISQFENCQTIHRALKYANRRGFMVNEREPLAERLVIVDESSMVGLDLMDHLLRAMPYPDHRIVFVGDPAQLPSLSNGNLMHSLIECPEIPSTYLDFVYRNKSTILQNANKIREGKCDLELDETFMMTDSKSDLLVIPMAYNPDPSRPMSDTLVISGIKKGEMGVTSLNLMLQGLFGKYGDIQVGGGYEVTMGDKVIQTVNDYNKGVFNGNIGYVTDLKKPDFVEVTFDIGSGVTHTAQYQGAHELKVLELAYCLTTHKVQGSEAKNVFVVIDPSHYMVHSRNWLYTAITRASQSVTIVGKDKVLKDIAETPDISVARNSKLDKRISGMLV